MFLKINKRKDGFTFSLDTEDSYYNTLAKVLLELVRSLKRTKPSRKKKHDER